MRRILFALLLFALPSFCASTAPVLVNTFKPMGSAAAEETGLDFPLMTDIFSRELAKAGKMNVVDRAKTLTSVRLQALSSSIGFSADEAALLGNGAGVPLVLLGRVRILGDRAWVQAGLFDADAQAMIKEANGYYSRKDLMSFGMRDIALKLGETSKPPETEKAKTPASGLSQRLRPWKWALAGVVTATSLFLIREYVISSGTPAAKTSTEMTVEW